MYAIRSYYVIIHQPREGTFDQMGYSMCSRIHLIPVYHVAVAVSPKVPFFLKNKDLLSMLGKRQRSQKPAYASPDNNYIIFLHSLNYVITSYSIHYTKLYELQQQLK